MRHLRLKVGNAKRGSRVEPAAPPGPPSPVLSRDAGGTWTLIYNGPTQDYWQVWACSDQGPWGEMGEIRTSEFPATDDDMAPDGVVWWQVKICGEDDNGNQCTPFSNIISHGPVP